MTNREFNGELRGEMPQTHATLSSVQHAFTPLSSELRSGVMASIHDAALTWRYMPADLTGAIEFGFSSGLGLQSLRPHFHDEIQITMVFAGRRAFRINNEMFFVNSGYGIVVPARWLHIPITEKGYETFCINIYVGDDWKGDYIRIFKLPNFGFRNDLSLMLNNLTKAIQPCDSRLKHVEADRINLLNALAGDGKSVGEIAKAFRMSREGFSRKVRRELGIGPQGLRIVLRLNHARRLLRDGQTIAAVAAEAGFSDQSHLTRLFRETFGTTPGLYQRS